jgi:hypothetical protein
LAKVLAADQMSIDQLTNLETSPIGMVGKVFMDENAMPVWEVMK